MSLLYEEHREDLTKTGPIARTTFPKHLQCIAWKVVPICLDAPDPAAKETIVRQTTYSASDITRSAEMLEATQSSMLEMNGVHAQKWKFCRIYLLDMQALKHSKARFALSGEHVLRLTFFLYWKAAGSIFVVFQVVRVAIRYNHGHDDGGRPSSYYECA